MPHAKNVNDSSFLGHFCQNNARCADDPHPDESLRHSEFLPTIEDRLSADCLQKWHFSSASLEQVMPSRRRRL
jgi:hypothetical protein